MFLKIILTVPNQDEREEIIQIIAPSISFANSIACLTPGYVGADLELICENVFQEMFQPGFCHLMVFLFIIKLYVTNEYILKINLLIV